MRRVHQRDDRGFTLIELLVVMIIIGILAAIAIPVFLSQRAKARDTATKSDVTRLGKELAAYYVDGTAQLYGAVSGNNAYVSTSSPATSSNALTTVLLSTGTTAPTSGAVVNYPTMTASCSYSTSWYVELYNSTGAQKTYYYSAQLGLSTTAPSACA